MISLTEYATDHEGKYPEGGSPLDALRKLYPKYDSSELAGLSGNERKTEEYLRNGKPLDSNVSSWVYFPGFKATDDTEIAIIWEREPGIFVNGSRGDGHAVGFVGGGYDQISSDNWPVFLKRQDELRAKALKR